MSVTRATTLARGGAICYVLWGVFHVKVAHDIYLLGATESGIAQGRTYQLAAYLFTLSLLVIGVAVRLNWRNSRAGFWLNLSVAGWADSIWLLIVVFPGYVGLARGLIPPAIFAVGALVTLIAQPRARVKR